MTTQYTPILQLALPVTGELNGTWGDVVNDNITSMVEQAIAGMATISTWTANAHTLTTANGTSDEARCAMILLQTGAGGTALTGTGQVICPSLTKLYVVKNASAYAVTIKTAAGTGIAVAAGDTTFVFCDGTNVLACVTQITNGHITGNLTVDGNTTLGDASGDTVTINAGTTTVKTGGAIRFEDNAGGEYVAIKAPAAVTTYTLTLPIDDGVSGQALITDGSGNLSWSTSASGDVYGPASATSTAVALFDGTTGKLIKNSGVTIDGSNNVSGVAQLNATTVDLTNLEVTNIKAKDGTAAITLADSTGALTINSATANGVFYANVSKVLTTGSALTFDGTSLTAGAGGTGTNDAFIIANSGSSASGEAAFVLQRNSANQFLLYTDGIENRFWGQTNIPQTFYINNSEQMRLTSIGLGIGTSSPSSKLEVASDEATTALRVTTASNQNYQLRLGFRTASLTGEIQAIHVGTAYRDIVLQRDGGNLGLGVTPSAWVGLTAIQVSRASISSDSGSIQLGVNTYYNGGWKYIGTGYATNYYQDSGQHVWRTAPSGTAGNAISFTQAMTLDAGGNLGLGLASASYRFDMSGTATAGMTVLQQIRTGTTNSYGFQIKGNYTTEDYLIQNYYSGYLAFGTSNTERMRIDSSGTLCIGTTSALSAAFKTNIENGRLGVSASSDQYALYLRYNTSTLGAYIGSPAADSLAFSSSAGNERMRIDSSGNVGIGTSSPSYQVSLGGTANGVRIALRNGTNEYAIGTETNELRLASYSATTFYSGGYAGTERMRIDSSGNVGIGTSSPNQKLRVENNANSSTWGNIANSSNGNGAGSGVLFTTDQGDAGAVFQNSSGNASGAGANSLRIRNLLNAPIGFETNGTERMRINSSGNLLVGTASNLGNFTLKGSGSSSATSSIYNVNSSGTLLFQTRNDGYVFLPTTYNNTTGNAANLFINSDGSLYRSTSSIKYKKEVRDYDKGLDVVMGLRPVYYKGTSDKDGNTQFAGLIAEEIEAAGLPEFVQYAQDGTPDALAYGNMVSLCIKAIQELKAELDATKAEVAALKQGV